MTVVQHRLSGARSADHAHETAFLPLILAWPCVLENNSNRLTNMRMQFNYEARAWLSLILSLDAPVLLQKTKQSDNHHRKRSARRRCRFTAQQLV